MLKRLALLALTLSGVSTFFSALPAYAQEAEAQEESQPERDLSHLSEETRAVIEELETALKDVTENGETMEKLERIGDLYLQLGEVQRTVVLFDKAIRDFGGSEELFFKFSRVLSVSGRPKLALETLDIGLEAFPESEKLLFERGKVYLGMRKPYAAQAAFKSLLEKDPDSEEYRYYLADAYRIQKKWDEAMAIIDKLLEEETDFLPVYLMKGDLLLATGELRDGVRYLEDVYEGHPESADAARVLVHAYQLYAYAESESGRLSRAVRSMRNALEVDPDNGESMVGLASFLHESGEYEEAEAVFKETIEKLPNYLEAYMMYGKMLQYLDRDEDAKAIYEQGLAKSRELSVPGATQTYLELLGRSR